MLDTGNYYFLNHLALFTGLTDRTLRNYISSGILKGEKINGIWHFTPEQVEEFICHPAVRPSILAKKHGIVYDFLLNTGKEEPQTCIILDIPNKEKKHIAEFFCYRINNGVYHDLQFSFDGYHDTKRVILKGRTADVLQLVTEFNSVLDGKL